jgi:uncharacterized protein YeaO (DUF488 family)
MSKARRKSPARKKKPSAKKPGGKTTKGFHVKRIYDPAEATDGLRVLVDRLWPRGVAKGKAHVDFWLKEIAPSDTLRRAVHSGKMEWSKFVTAYGRELKQEPAKGAAAALRASARHAPVTLLYAARDEEHNNAVALKMLLGRAK